MNVFTYLIIIILIIIVLYSYFGIYLKNINKSNIILRETIKGWTNKEKLSPDEKKKKRIPKSELKLLNNSTELKYSISFWVKIENSSSNVYNFKNINNSENNKTKKWFNLFNRNNSPKLEYNPEENILKLSSLVKEIGENNREHDKLESYNVGSIPLQRWNHICIALDGRNYDYYLNGKLKWSFVLKNVPMVNPGNIQLFEEENVFAKISYIRIFSETLNPKKVEFLYNNGAGRNFGFLMSGKLVWGIFEQKNKNNWFPSPKNALIDWYWLV